jgi:hypothetical protein
VYQNSGSDSGEAPAAKFQGFKVKNKNRRVAQQEVNGKEKAPE